LAWLPLAGLPLKSLNGAKTNYWLFPQGLPAIRT
jgi:hypothetical protein